MANLFTGNIELEGGYKVLATEADITFTEGNTYRIQVGSPCYLREGTTGKGFLAQWQADILSPVPFFSH